MLSGLNLGFGLVLIGLLLAGLVWLILRVSGRPGRASASPPLTASPDASDTDSNGVVVLEPGGRVEFANARVRDWFGFQQDEVADLEKMLRVIRPSDEFLEVCAVPGQKRLNLNGRPVEVTSHRVPGIRPQMLLSLRNLELTPSAEPVSAGLGSSVLHVVTDFTSAVSANLDLESTVRAVLDSTLRLVPADMHELKVWDHGTASLVSYRFLDANGSVPKLARSADGQFGGITERALQDRRPLLLTDPAAIQSATGPAASSAIYSYLGIPLYAGDELVGALELGNLSARSFTLQERDLLELLSSQIAATLRNSVLFEQERRRALEYSGLVGLAQAVGAIREPRELFGRLVDAVAPLFDAQILGFLLFDSPRQLLEAQVPFRGLPPHLIAMYRVPIPPGSPADELIRSHEWILTPNAAQDETWRKLGITDFAVAASLKDSVLVPLIASGHFQGYLQLSHRPSAAGELADSDRRLIQIVADQVAAILENSIIIRDSQQRSARNDVLARLAARVAEAPGADDVLSAGLQEIIALLEAEGAVALLLDESRGALSVHRTSATGLTFDSAAALPRLTADDPAYLQIATGSRRTAISGRLTADLEVSAFYRGLLARSGFESFMAVPMVARGHPLGELIVVSRQTEAFHAHDSGLLSAAAADIAAALDRLQLAAQTDSTLRRRVDQLMSVARVSRELGSARGADELLRVIHDEMVSAVGADCGSILLLDSDHVVNDPRQLQSAGCELDAQLSSWARRALDVPEAIAVRDVQESPGERPPHEGVRAALFVPIVEAGRAIGLVQLHALEPAAFDQGALETARTLAVQAGLALSNARRVQAEHRQAELLQRRAATLQKFSEVNASLHGDTLIENSLALIAHGVQESTPFRVVLISIYEAETGMLRRVAGAGIDAETLAQLQGRQQLLSSLRELIRPEFRISNSYYVPADQTPVLPADVHYVYAGQYSEAQSRLNAWDPDDFLLVPLNDPQGNPVGLMSLDDPSNGLRPDVATIEAAELFAGQAVQVILSSRQLRDLNSRIDSLSSGLSRQQQLLSVTQNDLPVLLRKDLEQTMALHALERRAQRVRAGLSITEAISRQLDASSALLALGRETLTQFGMSMALVAESTAEGSRLLHILGNVPPTANVEALYGQRNPLRSSLQTGAPILVPNLEESEEWRESPLLGQLRAKGIISLPVMIENRPVAAMMAIGLDPLPTLTEEDRQVYLQISRQASVVLQNISLLNETRTRLHEVNILLEFSRQLGGLDPAQIVEALLDSARHALTTAHAGIVLLWDEQAGTLEPRAASGYADDESMLQITYRSGEALPGAVFAAGAPRRVDEIDFARDYALEPTALGLYRRATGGRLPVSSLLLPIFVEDKGIGLLILDNFNTVGAFKPEDEALVLSLSQQAALSLENVRLLGALTERAGQLQGLNEVATAVATSLRSEQLVVALMEQIGRVLDYDSVTIWLREGDRLTVAGAAGFADSERRLGLSVALADSALFREMSTAGQPLSVGDVRDDPRFPQSETNRLSWLGIPMIAKGEFSGLIALEKSQTYYYSPEQIQLGATLASQAALALENANLYERSLQHAAELNERSERLALLNSFSSALSGLLDADQILALTADDIRAALRAARVAVVSLDGPRPSWVASSPKPKQQLPRAIADVPLFARLRESLGSFMTDHADAEPELDPLRALLSPGTHTAVIMPLATGHQVLAFVVVSEPGGGSLASADLDLARTLANQASIALQNARLYQSTVRSAEQLTLLNRAGAEIGTSLDPEDIYASILKAAETLMPVDGFVITLLDEETQDVDAVYAVADKRRLPVRRLPLGRGLGSQVISTGSALMLDSPQSIRALDGTHLAADSEPQSGLAVPMTVGGRVVGMLSVRSNHGGAYKPEDLGLLAALANQAVVTIQNGRLFAETQRLAQDFEQRVVERTAELRREQQNTETLLRILTEVSSSLDLDRALNRTLSLLNDAVRADQGTIMLLDADSNLLKYRAGFGYVSERTPGRQSQIELKVGEGLAGWVVQNREAVLVDDVRGDPRWASQPPSPQREAHRSAVLAPLMAGDDAIGVLMVFSRREAFFTGESLTLVKAIANQVAVAINNARLYELIRDQAERLGLMLRKEQEEASRSQAILGAVADGVLVTGADNRVSFINSSVQHILGPETREPVGQPLEQLAGLFGEPGQAWTAAVQRWAEAPGLYASGESYAERIQLPNDRIALIHAAPVILEDDFLGTVSILRDITHEVEVDRLKSEFVATVSHELRTPMTSIKGYIEMLLMGAVGAVNENQQHFLEIVRNNIDRLNALVGDLLDVSRIESGNVTLSPEDLDLVQLTDEIIQQYRQKSQEEKKPTSFRLDARTVSSVLGDPERVRQILRTLLDNAYHYTPENGTVVVKIHNLPRRAEVQVDVTDTGIGIPTADQERVFERFFRGENPAVLATPGTGLGLSIARQLVEMHRGRIFVQSTGVEGEGSTFSFTLPQSPKPRPQRKPSASAPTSRKRASKKPEPAGTPSK